MTTETPTGVAAALEHLHANADAHLDELDAFLSIPSVSADPQRDGEVRRAAAWVADQLGSIGFEHIALHETSGHPIITADWLHAGATRPTVLVYCHYDVQPDDPIDEWIRPPFEPRHEDGRIYARGSGDDKGQVFIHLKAAEAWMRTAGRLPLNLRIFFEGDEEVGSEPVETFIAEHPELLAADVCVVSDTGMQDDEGTPALTYGLRGIAYFELKVSGPFQDLHSGGYGGAVANPANVLVKLLASLQDERGRVTVPGFYDRVRPLTDADRAAYASVPFDEEEYRASIDVPELWDGEQGYTALERLSGRPTFDINGLWGGYSGEGAKTIIPAWAAAKFSCRLVPDQDYHEIERLVMDHVRKIAPPTVKVEIRVIHGGAPALTPLDHPAVEIAAEALRAAFGKEPVYLRSGGSIPVVAALEAQIGLKSILVGFASPNGNFHAPNEWMPIANIVGGMDAVVRLWGAFGEMSPAELSGEAS
jgi:acetylornithine deacetylase/succinyl-diaminopimelate desuccinylase-like protein